MINKMVKELLLGKVEINMKENGRIIYTMLKGFIQM